MPLTPWKYKAGVEMTFQRPVKTARGFLRWSQFDSLYDVRKARDLIPDHLVYKIEIDPDCIETPTRILTSWSDAEYTITAILNCARRLELIAKNKRFSTGGGGHVHASGMCPLTKYAIIRDMQNRPYVPWFFADPDTTNQANSIPSYNCNLLSKKWSQIEAHPRAHYYTPKFMHTSMSYLDTIEFRFFDCFMEYQRYEESLAFVQAYVKWIDALVKKGKKFGVTIHNRQDLLRKYNDYVRCLEEFQMLIENIGLPWTRYKHYISNLDERFEDEELLW